MWVGMGDRFFLKRLAVFQSVRSSPTSAASSVAQVVWLKSFLYFLSRDWAFIVKVFAVGVTIFLPIFPESVALSDEMLDGGRQEVGVFIVDWF
ncbi:hypothetical protein CEXT_313551 [Caerostris extrusa]|uniref:Uncharacterized protein n=1 Tax=Caerostris extrusa TaxID=172846 RepID=A0AAV4TE20_CAEEX|nr:hypothetical protein CEXT_313551 [Caerostris extrusa]